MEAAGFGEAAAGSLPPFLTVGSNSQAVVRMWDTARPAFWQEGAHRASMLTPLDVYMR